MSTPAASLHPHKPPSFMPAPIGSEVVVHAGGDHIGVETRRVRDRRGQEKRRRAAAQIDMKIFDFRAPAGHEFDFDSAPQRPAASRLAAIVSGDEGADRRGRVGANLAEGAAARRVKEPVPNA